MVCHADPLGFFVKYFCTRSKTKIFLTKCGKQIGELKKRIKRNWGIKEKNKKDEDRKQFTW